MSTRPINSLVGYDDDLGYFDRETGRPISEEEAAQISLELGEPFMQTIDPSPGAGTISAAQNQAALDEAARQAAGAVGIADKPKGDWTQAEALAYISQFRSIILANPNRFNALTYDMAQRINVYRFGYSDSVSTISPAAFGVAITDMVAFAAQSVGDFYSGPIDAVQDVKDGFFDALTGMGKSVSVISALAPWILGAAAVGFLYFAVQSTGKDPGGQFSKAVGAFR
jgi:hypothetical protein